MFEKITLYISNQGLTIYRWEHKKLIHDLYLSDPDNDQSSTQVQNYFKKNNKVALLVIDLLEETHTLESIPHIKRNDRKALLERKKRQLFPNINYIYTKLKGRSIKTDRQDDLVLFTAITEDAQVKSWLQMLVHAQVKISGIYSLPVLFEQHIKQFQGHDNKLLICVSEQNGTISLRQSFFKDNILILSRFKQVTETCMLEATEEIREDIERSLRFVGRRFKINTSNSLSSFFFGTGNLDKDFFDTINFSLIQLTPTYAKTSIFSQLQGYFIADDCGFSGYIASLLAKNIRNKTHYQDSGAFFYFRHHLINTGLNIVSAILLLFMLLYAGKGIINSLEIEDHVIHLNQQRMEVLHTLSITPPSPSFHGFNPYQLQHQLEAYRKVTLQSFSAKPPLLAISQILEQFPFIQLDQIAWGEGEGEIEGEEEEESMMFETLVDDNVGSKMQEPEQRKMTISLTAQVVPFNGNFRESLAIIERFRESLNSDLNIDQVVITQIPVNIESGKELTGTIKQQLDPFLFTIKMDWLR